MSHAQVLRPAEVVRRTVHGVVSVGGGQVAAQILNIGGTIFLARILTPAEFGLVAILMFLLALLTVLGDLGLGMSLVRRPVEPSDADYRAVTSFQQMLAVAIVLAAFAATPVVLRAYGLSRREWWLLPMMAGAIVMDSIRFLPLTRLERAMQFERRGVIEITQALIFNAVLLSLAVRPDVRADSFPVAVLARSAGGALVANLLGPRVPGWGWDWQTVRPYLAFGLPYQGVNIINVAKNSLVPIFVGLLIGRVAVGHLQWAAMVAGFPLTGLILFQQIYVASFGRLQDHPAELGRLVTQIVAVANGVVAPVAVATLILIDPIVRLVFGAKWLEAVPLVYWLWLGCLVIPTAAPLTGLLHALGHSRLVFRVILLGSIATWILGVPLALRFGEVGVAASSLGVHAATLVLWPSAYRAVPFRVARPVFAIWLCALLGGGAAWWLQTWHPAASILQVTGYGVAALCVYLLALGICAAVLVRRSRERLSFDLWRQSATALHPMDGTGQ